MGYRGGRIDIYSAHSTMGSPVLFPGVKALKLD